MKLLLDTHALLWWLADDAALGQSARDLVADPANDVLASIVSLWEVQVKVRAGRLRASLPDILREIEAQAFVLLPIAASHLVRLGDLPMHHRDPFDHLLMAQAFVEGAVFMSEDHHVPSYGVPFVTCSGPGVVSSGDAGG